MSEGHEDKTPGRFSWNECITSDPEAAKKFYGELFGWTTETMPMPKGEYTFFKRGDVPAAGMMKKPDEMGQVPSHWMAYVTVESIEASCAKAEELGGKVVQPKIDIPEHGSLAVIEDPTGAVFAFWEFSDKASC